MMYKFLAMLAGALMMVLGTSLGVAADCGPEKSLFVNIASERVRAVQVGLLVAMANASPEDSDMGGQGAAVQLFFADAAAPYVIDLEKLSNPQRSRLNGYLKSEFGYQVDDVERLQSQDPMIDGLPGILWLRDTFFARIFACSLCVTETLHAIGIEIGPEELADYMIEGAEMMTPPAFDVIYDSEADGCTTSAAVISY
jgi:hypothetical protein